MPSRLTLRFVMLAPLFLIAYQGYSQDRAAPADPNGVKEYLFCFWNVENLFDDHDDRRRNAPDDELDRWFARDQRSLQLKLNHLTEALLALNDGKGPDILAIAEVESPRAAKLLKNALNGKLGKPELFYKNVLMKDLDAGRHIAPAIITRLPVIADKTRLHGSQLRILEGHINVEGQNLVVLASHWTARTSDPNGRTRGKYGDQIYGVYQGMFKTNPKVEFLVCGDFNDPPEADSVTRHLRASGDRAKVLQEKRDPLLFDVFAGKDPKKFGTHYHNQWWIFDQIAVSPGLLDDQGWGCAPDSAQSIQTHSRRGDPLHRPWRFGDEYSRFTRGYSDHYPVTLKLRVAIKGKPANP